MSRLNGAKVHRTNRDTDAQWGNLLVWLAANCVLPTFGVGILGPLVFGMNLGDSMYATIRVELSMRDQRADPAGLRSFSSTSSQR